MPLPPFDQTPPRRILLVCTQRIGDVLLATPLARSLKQTWPQAELHFLVFKGTEGVLAGNPDIDRVIAYPHRSDWRGKLAQLRELWRRYDLALGTMASDRTRLYGWVGAKFRVGFVNEWEKGKTLLLDRWRNFDDLHLHTVALNLQLAELLGVAPCYQVVPPSLNDEQRIGLRNKLAALGDQPYAVLHPSPKFAYKMWRQEGWVELARWLVQQGVQVVLTGGPDQDEREYVAVIAAQTNSLNLAGQLSLAETAELLSDAKLFVGPDTAVTHIAAAVGTPTIALFGPSNPVKWGPWPKDWQRADSPWQWRGSGRHGNVMLIQGPGDCVPCRMEGCDRHVGSRSDCLQRIGNDEVIGAASAMLATATVIPIVAADDRTPE
ncbi:MAG: glycosyltransferase family 9 protein [Proteobacteria bacterium]|nr:glycosyltransferase family 9 protein [Pseudomonadota bacterium]